MGYRMDDLHAPTIASGPTSSRSADSATEKLTLQQLITRKENLEAELSALGSVLDSVLHLPSYRLQPRLTMCSMASKWTRRS